ncbi:MAG: hypothetical protein AB7S38_28715 [Vulcanimicrobiota bacterium]
MQHQTATGEVTHFAAQKLRTVAIEIARYAVQVAARELLRRLENERARRLTDGGAQ